jgi:cytochrome c
MSSFEFNKLAASLLVALIVAMVTGLVAEELVHPKRLEQAAYPIAGGESTETKVAAAPAAEKPAPIPADLLAKADPAKGADIAKKCAACHSFDKGGANKVGPNLYGVIGGSRAHEASYQYSDAMKKLGGTWTPQEIAAFIFNPKQYLPGTKMGFAGLAKPEERADVIAYLNKQSDSPADLTKAE